MRFAEYTDSVWSTGPVKMSPFAICSRLKHVLTSQVRDRTVTFLGTPNADSDIVKRPSKKLQRHHCTTLRCIRVLEFCTSAVFGNSSKPDFYCSSLLKRLLTKQDISQGRLYTILFFKAQARTTRLKLFCIYNKCHIATEDILL